MACQRLETRPQYHLQFQERQPQSHPQRIQGHRADGAELELIGEQLLAGDSTKLRAQNSKQNNFNPRKIEKHLAYIDVKLEEYNAILATGDQDVPEAGGKTIAQKVANPAKKASN